MSPFHSGSPGENHIFMTVDTFFKESSLKTPSSQERVCVFAELTSFARAMRRIVSRETYSIKRKRILHHFLAACGEYCAV